jgi:nucleoside-diphosphate-sugar epimerase
MKVLIIGGTGLISTSIANQLLEAGEDVTVFNRGKTKSRIGKGANVITGDRSDFSAFESTFKDSTYDVVVDMVAFRPEETLSAIEAFSGRTGQFVHCSTVCVYSGPPTTIPTKEDEPYHSPGTYGKNKILCEQALLSAYIRQKFPVTIMRPSHSYGEGGGIIRAFGSPDTFVDRLRKGKKVVMPGDGTGMWAACHVDDVATGFIGTFGNDKTIGEAYQITSDEYFTWNTYHEIVAREAGGEFKPVYIPTDILGRVAPGRAGSLTEILAWPSIFSTEKIRKDTGYRGQTIDFVEGTRRTLKWLEAEGKIADSDADTYEDSLIAAWESATADLPTD